MTSTIDAEEQALRGQGFTGTRITMELAWLRAHGATSPNRTDGWMEFLDARAVPAGTLPDRQRAWLQSFLPPETPGTLPDLLHAFWNAGGGFP